ncbi:MAG TPA: hypothetical protein VIX13_05215, partial [Candidatus Eisenbacteria bacterium]
MNENRKRFLALAIAGTACSLFLVGALLVRPGIDVASDDLAVLESWIRSGRLEDLPRNPSHLPKPGYLLYLRLLMPTGGRAPHEARRFLIANAVLLSGAVLCAALALRRERGSAGALPFCTAILLFVPLRDSADYVASEPLAAALGLGFCGIAARSVLRGPIAASVLGASAAAAALLRPNLGWCLAAIGILVLLSDGRRRTARALALVAGFVCATIVFAAVGGWTKL